MNTYTQEELCLPSTYESDPELATFTRKVAGRHWDENRGSLNIPFGDHKRAFLAGQYAEIVYVAIQDKLIEEKAKVDAEIEAMFKRNAKIYKALETLTLPDGIEIVGNTDDKIFIKAPWDGGDLAKRFGRIGGEWDRQAKHFVFPVESSPSLQRVLNNWRKAQNDRDTVAAEQKRQHEAAKAKAQAEREAQWAEEKRRRDVLYAAQRRAQAKAVADRVLVKAGEYKIGDMLEGKPITGFGKQWTESDLSHGQLYQPCEWGRCDGEPVCSQCFLCSKHCTCGEQITWCYAYFS